VGQQSGKKIKSFTVGFKNSEISELEEAKVLARRYETDHTEILLEPQVLNDVASILEYYGEPFADSSCIPTFYVTKSISGYVKVALSGDAGDELFGGYSEYVHAYHTDEYLKKYPNPFGRKLATLWSKVEHRIHPKLSNLGAYQYFSNSTGAQRLHRNMGFHELEKRAIYSESFLELSNGFSNSSLNDLWRRNQSDNLTDTLLATSLETRLLNDYLVKVDRASMLNSLEVRMPFLTRELVEFAFSIDKSLKFKHGQSKYLLKRLAEKRMDENIFARKKKGFQIPLNKWLRNEMKDMIFDLLSDEVVRRRGLFKMKNTKKLVRGFLQGDNGSTHKVWALICLELWFRKFVDRN
jgi:asparagine synthase (glutamine-hydrolysing)